MPALGKSHVDEKVDIGFVAANCEQNQDIFGRLFILENRSLSSLVDQSQVLW